MNSYLDKPTIESRLAGYLESDDLKEDLGLLENEYYCNKQPIPSVEQLRSEAAMQKLEWLKQLSECESEGHQFTETADGENGTSDLECGRCGMTYHCQW